MMTIQPAKHITTGLLAALACLIFILSATTLPAQTTSVTGGGSTYSFLNLTPAPRIAALGGIAFATTATDVNFAFYNPALLDSNHQNKLALNFVNYLADIKFGSGIYAGKLKKIGYYSLGFQYFDYGTFTRTDAGANELGTFNPQDYVLQMGYTYPIVIKKPSIQSLNIGTNIKFIGSQYEIYSSAGVAADVVLSYKNLPNQLAVALLLKNIGTQLKPYTADNYEPLPFDMQLNLSKRLAHLPLRVGVVLHHLHRWDIRYDDPLDRYYKERQLPTAEGVVTPEKTYFFDKALRHVALNGEFNLGKALHLQLGYNHLRRQELSLPTYKGRNGISFGVGIHTQRIGISYANSAYGLVGASQHLSVNINVNKK
jgi:hypothetical protein